MKKILKVKYKIIVITIEIITLFLIFFLSYNFLIMPKGKQTFYLPASNMTTLKTTLEENGYKIYMLDKLLLPFIEVPEKGWYSIYDNEGRYFFFTNLYRKKTPPSQLMTVKVFAGETSMELSKRLANDMDLNTTHLLNVYQQKTLYKEGDIFEGRYTLAKKIDEETALSYLFEVSKEKFQDFEMNITKKTLSTPEKKILLNIASIIQKESNAKEEMPIISSVIYNRLKKNMRLQMDGTLNYGKYAHTIVTPERIKTDESLYNTYKHKGLPPTPLSTVSIEALKAAYNPKNSKYLFFMLTQNGTHVFAEDYKKHLLNVHKFKEAMKDKNSTKEQNSTKKSSSETIKKSPILHTSDTKKKSSKKAKSEKKSNTIKEKKVIKIKEHNKTTKKSITIEHVL